MNFWHKLLDTFLARLIKDGTLHVTWPDGRKTRYGHSARLTAHMDLKDDAIISALCRKPEMALGEGYMNAQIETDDLFALLCLMFINYEIDKLPLLARGVFKTQMALKRITQRNTPTSSRKNAAHSYDLTDELFGLFLDEDRQYTCAYFSEPDMTLEQAQAAKRQHIGKKLMIEPGMRILDIGCGWGGMARTLARDFGAQVTGVTLARNQVAYATARAASEGLSDKVDYRLQDYRLVPEKFDRILSVGMLEHVGVPQYPTYFQKVKAHLEPGGISLAHCVMRNTPPSLPSGWLLKYIFPGGYAPSLSEVVPHAETAGLKITDIEIWRGHYGKTIHEWGLRTIANKDRIIALYDERFYRMWMYYLKGTEAVFYYGNQCNFQLQMTHDMFDVPVTRHYIDTPADKRMTPLPY